MATALPWHMMAKSVVSVLRCWIDVLASYLAARPTSSRDRAWRFAGGETRALTLLVWRVSRKRIFVRQRGRNYVNGLFVSGPRENLEQPRATSGAARANKSYNSETEVTLAICCVRVALQYRPER